MTDPHELGFRHCLTQNFATKCSLLRTSPAVLSMWPCTLKLDEEKSKHVGLAQQFLLLSKQRLSVHPPLHPFQKVWDTDPQPRMLPDNAHMRRLRRCDEFAAAATAMKQCPEEEYEASRERSRKCRIIQARRGREFVFYDPSDPTVILTTCRFLSGSRSRWPKTFSPT
jgi:hypothetical protein